jgi:hypothetical protein|tara:strand:+ start:511 stop:783 length:273 start_codon:yes stop_codon:yes gene_type:complete
MTCDKPDCQAVAVYSDLNCILDLVSKEMDWVAEDYHKTKDNTHAKMNLKERAISLDELYDRVSDLIEVVNVPENEPIKDDKCDDDCNCHQ